MCILFYQEKEGISIPFLNFFKKFFRLFTFAGKIGYTVKPFAHFVH